MKYASDQNRNRHSNSYGFAIIEALIAMLVMSFGMLAVVHMQSTFSISSDDAKLRSEATRLAEQKLDELRAFEQVAVGGGKASFLGIVSSTVSETLTPTKSNATFTRSWVVGDSSAAMFKTVNVTVAWADRTGNQSLTMSTVIARADPQSIGTLGVGPGTTVIRKPKNRNVNIPYPAVSVNGGGDSAFQPIGSRVVIVFDNLSGAVKRLCTEQDSAPTEGGTFASGTTGCSEVDGYLLSGYIRFCTTNHCNGADVEYTANAKDQTLPLNESTPFSLDTSNQTVGTPSLLCYSSQQVSLKSQLASVADTGQADNLVASRFIGYACIAYSVDHDSNSTTPKRWWGRVTLNPNGWIIGNGASNYKVCRFSADYDLTGSMTNNEHPLWYRGVTGALDSQNYLVVPGNDSCPTDGPTNPVGGDFVNVSTVTHQTDANTLTGAELSFTCSSSTCTGGNKVTVEPGGRPSSPGPVGTIADDLITQ